jgi:serine/threonine protein kinase
VADFGIATTLNTSSIKQTNALGTYQYMAPEEFDDLICKESDQFAWAVLLMNFLQAIFLLKPPI